MKNTLSIFKRELKSFFDHFDGKSFDILQIRPIQKIGNTEYNDFDLEPLKEDYTILIDEIREQCKKNHITLLASDKIPDKNKVLLNGFSGQGLSVL